MDDDDYNIAFDVLTEAVQKLGAAGVTKTDLLPWLVDFTAAAAIALGGEDAIRVSIIRMQDWIMDYREGTFPVKKD